jgi:hypothetical protein
MTRVGETHFHVAGAEMEGQGKGGRDKGWIVQKIQIKPYGKPLSCYLSNILLT